MNRARWTVLIIAVCCLALGAGNIATAKKKPSGQDLYKEYCKPCHTADSEHGEYTPMTLIQDQWTRFFDEDYVSSHEGVMDTDHGNQPVTDAITDEDLEKIREFAVDHAADSEQPMTCG